MPSSTALMTRSVLLPSRASRKPVMMAAAKTRILPSFFVAPGEYLQNGEESHTRHKPASRLT